MCVELRKLHVCVGASRSLLRRLSVGERQRRVDDDDVRWVDGSLTTHRQGDRYRAGLVH